MEKPRAKAQIRMYSGYLQNRKNKMLLARAGCPGSVVCLRMSVKLLRIGLSGCDARATPKDRPMMGFGGEDPTPQTVGDITASGISLSFLPKMYLGVPSFPVRDPQLDIT